MQALLDRVIALLTPSGDDAPDHPEARALIGFRSVAVDLPALACLVVEDALAEADAQDARVVAADVSGVMRTDEGWRCWGFLDVEPSGNPIPTAVRMDSVAVERMGRTLVLVGAVRIEDEP